VVRWRKKSLLVATEKAHVEYDSSKLKTSDIINIVGNLGYRAEKVEDISKDREKEQLKS